MVVCCENNKWFGFCWSALAVGWQKYKQEVDLRIKRNKIRIRHENILRHEVLGKPLKRRALSHQYLSQEYQFRWNADLDLDAVRSPTQAYRAHLGQDT